MVIIKTMAVHTIDDITSKYFPFKMKRGDDGEKKEDGGLELKGE